MLVAGARWRRPARTQGARVLEGSTWATEDAAGRRSSAFRRHSHCFASPSLVRGDVRVRVGHGLYGVLRGLEGGLADEHLLRRVLGRARVMLDGGLEDGLDARRFEDGLDLPRPRRCPRRALPAPCRSRSRLLSDVDCLDRSVTAMDRSTLQKLRGSTLPKGSSMISKSLGTTVSGKTALASSAASRPE